MVSWLGTHSDGSTPFNNDDKIKEKTVVEEWLAINEWGWVGYEELSRWRRVSAEVDNTIRDLLNSSYPTKAEFINCFIIHSK